MLAQYANIIIGVWLMLAPYLLKYNGLQADMDHVFGPVIATLAAVAVAECTRQVRLWNIPLGCWLIIQPWILGYDNTSAIINSMIAGILVIIFSLVKGQYSSGNFGGGWSALWK